MSDTRASMKPPRSQLRRWGGCALWAAAALPLISAAASAAPPDAAVPLAVIGDSDSHGYHDTRAFPPGSPDRGGPRRSTTYQWTEVLATLRGGAVDLGARGTWGMNGRVASAVRAVGLEARAPRKVDHRHNLAVSGNGCDDLNGGYAQQVPTLIRLMDEQPERWQRGVVVIRMGVNTFGKASELDRLSRDAADARVAGLIDRCVQQVGAAVDALAAAHPRTRVVLVGIYDNRHWAPYLARWSTVPEQARISAGLDRFDQGLQRIAQARPGVAFFDDRQWFASHWGGRDAQGRPAYRSVRFGPLTVTNSQGDEPTHATLADGHAGTAWNALWAQALVALLNREFGLHVPPLTDAEMASLLQRPFS